MTQETYTLINDEVSVKISGSAPESLRTKRKASRRAPAPPLFYIENGVLKAPVCYKKTAQKFGFTPSGSAAAAYDGAPETGPDFLGVSADPIMPLTPNRWLGFMMEVRKA